MADGRRRAWLPAAAVSLLAAGGVVAGEPAPDMAFLEYLGSWEEDDRDWIALAHAEGEAEDAAAPAARDEQPDEEAEIDERTD